MKHVLENGTSKFQLLLFPAILGTWHLVTVELDPTHRVGNQMDENGPDWEPLMLMKKGQWVILTQAPWQTVPDLYSMFEG